MYAPLPTNRLALLALLLPLLLTTACGEPRSAPLSSLRSPDSVHAARWCAIEDAAGVRSWVSAAQCSAQSPREGERLVSRLLVANRGNRYLHLVDTDAQRPALINLDLSVPGVTGLVVPRGPAWVFGLRAPALALVISAEERSVSFVDAARGRTIATDLATFDENLLAAAPLSGRNEFVVALGASRELQLFAVRQRCGAEEDVHRSDCRLRAELSLQATWSLDGIPRHVVADARGRVYVIADGVDGVSVIGMSGPGLATCGGSPCELARLSPRLPCELEAMDGGEGESSDEDGTSGGETAPMPNGSASGASVPDSAGSATEDSAAEEEGSIPPSSAPGGTETGTEGARSEETTADAEPDPAQVAARCARVMRGQGVRPVTLGPMALTERGDLLLVGERQASEVLVFDTRALTLLDVNARNRLRDDAVGIPIPSARITNLLTHTLDFLDTLQGGVRLQRELRVAYVSTSAGQTWVLELDEYGALLQDDEVIGEDRIARFRRRSRSDAPATVSNLNCRLPDVLDRLVARRGLDRCDNALVPVLRPVPADVELPEGRGWTSASALDLFTFPQAPAFAVERDGNDVALGRVDRPDAWRVPNEQWELRWEGTLPGLDQRALQILDEEEVQLSGIGLCEAGADLCASGLDLRTCDPVRVLCEAGVDPCTRNLDLPTLCPSFADRNRDLCVAGVEEGDLLEIIRPTRNPEQDVPRECDPWVLAADGLVPAGAARAEFEITAVSPWSLRVAPFEADRDEEGVPATALPPARCLEFGVRARVRARQSWLLTGVQRFGHESARRAEAGQCVLRPDRSADEATRPEAGSVFTFPFGVSFRIEHPSAEPVQRDHVLSFRTVSNQVDAFVDTGASVSGAAVARPIGRNPRIAFSDESRDTLRIFDARTLRQISPFPLP